MKIVLCKLLIKRAEHFMRHKYLQQKADKQRVFSKIAEIGYCTNVVNMIY